MAFFYRDYVSVAERRARAQQVARRLARSGRKLDPVVFDADSARGKNRSAIAGTFWGKAWCDNLEHYADLANRLERGRTYVRNGSVLDLKIDRGSVSALVMGTDLYEITISIRPLAAARWRGVVKHCAGRIDSLVELLSGQLSDAVMGVVTDPKTGLFPAPRELEMSCSCPDWAGLCKHLAAALYGIGARLDRSPELLFVLRGVDPDELIEHAASGTDGITGITRRASPSSSRRLLEPGSIASIFGLDLDFELVKNKPSRKRKKAKKRRQS